MNKVSEIHKSNLYGVVIETGCSTSVSSKLERVAGASKTVKYSFQPYSKKAEEKFYGKFERSVSKEFVDSILGVEAKENDDCNFVLSSSWQLHSDENPLQTPHGWFGLYDITRNKKYHLHFTFNRLITKSFNDLLNGKHNPKTYYQETRDILIDVIGEIGCSLIHTLINGNINEFDLNEIPFNQYLSLDSAYTDDALDINLLMSVLEKYKNDYFLIFKDNHAIRMEDFMRENDSFSILKGSFNPVTHGHVELLDFSKQSHESAQAFLISTFRWDKPHISASEIEERINNINKLGRTLIVCKSIFYYDTFKLLNFWTYNKRFYFPIGMDTLIRIHQTDLATVEKNNSNIKNQLMKATIRGYVEKNIKNYPNFKFLVFGRKGYEKPDELNLYNGITEYINREDDGISSTAIREGRMKNKLTT
jgi:nicotinic acid mononucleotide adenylyltransferase